jgi:ABC-type amino acid transport substrate-binding protein
MMTRTRRWAAIVGVGLILTVAAASAASADTTRRDADGAPGSTIKVGIKPLDPFVTRNGTQYHGFSIDLWNEIARRNSWQTSYVWHDTLPPLLRDVQTSTVDVGIAGITITKDREHVLDFSYPTFSAGLGVMTTPRGSSPTLTSQLASFLTAGLGRYLLAMLAALIIAGHLVWLATRRHTQLGYLAGVGLGIYKAAGLGLVGDYGVADPKRPLGRAAAVIWTIVGVSFVSLFTAALASQLTVRNIESKITGLQDLSGVKVATVTASSAAAYLTAHARFRQGRRHRLRRSSPAKPHQAHPQHQRDHGRRHPRPRELRHRATHRFSAAQKDQRDAARHHSRRHLRGALLQVLPGRQLRLRSIRPPRHTASGLNLLATTEVGGTGCGASCHRQMRTFCDDHVRPKPRHDSAPRPGATENTSCSTFEPSRPTTSPQAQPRV